MERGEIFMGAMVALLIFLSVTLYLAMAGNGSTGSTDLWTFSINESSPWSGMFIGDDGTLYTTTDNAIEAIAIDGKIKWFLPTDYRPMIMHGVSDDDRIFISVSRLDSPYPQGKELLALHADGSVIWRQPLPDMGSMDFTVAGDRLYRYNDSYFTVYDCDNGSALWKVKVRGWLTIDPQGNIYLGHDEYADGEITEDLRSYDQDGKLRWVRPFSDYGINYWDLGWGRTWALDGFMLMADGHVLAAIDYGGKPLWHRNISNSVELAGVDESGRIYLILRNVSSNGMWYGYPDYEIIYPDGSATKLDGRALGAAMGEYRALSNGVAYFAKMDPAKPNRAQDDPDTYRLYAYDLPGERVLWTSEIRFSPVTVEVNASSFDGIMSDYMDKTLVSSDNNVTLAYSYGRYDPEVPGLKNRSTIRVMAGSNAVYVSYWAYNYEYPAQFNRSTCTYAGGICALDSSGNLVWSRPTDAYISSMTTKNSTIYYRTVNGRFSAASVDVAAGFVLAAFYLFFRFFLVGAVSRARSRLDKNPNRTMVFEYISHSPGSTLYDIARGLSMNIGTVRYHLFILGANHRIKACRGRGKHVRYFVNRGDYTDDEMLVLSLMKREHMSKVLYILMASPGAQNVEISRATGLHDSAVSRYLRELADRGIVDKRRAENGKLSYMLETRYRDAIANVGQSGEISGSLRTSVSCMPVTCVSATDK